MVENLEHLIRRAADRPLAPRAALFRELLRSETYLLTVGEPLAGGSTRRVARGQESFPVWAQKDAELGGVWFPVFPARDRVRDFVAARRLKAPRGQEFLWMGHLPGQVFGLLRGVRRFAGLRLHLDPRTFVPLGWPQVRALAAGRVPEEAVRYELPVAKLSIPAGQRVSFGRLAAWPGEERPVLMSVPGAGRFRPEDLRRLVRLPLSGGGHAWMPCRHFLQVLKRHGTGEGGEDGRVSALLDSLIAFEQYGEAEALCSWIEARGQQAYAWLALSAVLGRTGRMAECADLCRRGRGKHPGEKSFRVNGARALMALGRREEAEAWLSEAMRDFPGDAALLAAQRDLAAPDPAAVPAVGS